MIRHFASKCAISATALLEILLVLRKMNENDIFSSDSNCYVGGNRFWGNRTYGGVAK